MISGWFDLKVVGFLCQIGGGPNEVDGGLAGSIGPGGCMGLLEEFGYVGEFSSLHPF